MYICISSNKHSLTQMEISDYIKNPRKIYFDLDDQKEFRKAARTLRPKGIKRRRKKGKKQKFTQQTINNLFALDNKKSLPKILDQKPIFKEEPKPDEVIFYIDEDIIDKFGAGGNLEIICPFCQDYINFNYVDLDEKKLKSTRVCSCDAITRISTRGFNKNIFSDIGISQDLFNKSVQKIENDIQDEYGNIIYTYAFKNLK